MQKDDGITVPLLISMSNTNYCVYLTPIMSKYGCPDYCIAFTNLNKTINSYIISVGSAPVGAMWLVIGL